MPDAPRRRAQGRLVWSPPPRPPPAARTYSQLSLFGDVFERVRADYVEKPDDTKLVEAAISGMSPRLILIRAT